MKKVLILLGLAIVLFMMTGCEESTSSDPVYGYVKIDSYTLHTLEGTVDGDSFTLAGYGVETFEIKLDNENDVEDVVVTYRIQNTGNYVSETVEVYFEEETVVYVYEDDGALWIENNDADYGWYEIENGGAYWLDPGYYVQHSFSPMLANEEYTTSVEIGGEYVFTETLNPTIIGGETTAIYIDTNAGEFVLENVSGYWDITEVYLSPSSSGTWGEDDLNGTIEPGYYASWYVTPGYWDVKFVDSANWEFEYYDIYIDVEETYWHEYDGYSDRGKPAGNKAENAATYTTITEDRVQKNDNK
jgi:hypothetical protein